MVTDQVFQPHGCPLLRHREHHHGIGAPLAGGKMVQKQGDRWRDFWKIPRQCWPGRGRRGSRKKFETSQWIHHTRANPCRAPGCKVTHGYTLDESGHAESPSEHYQSCVADIDIWRVDFWSCLFRLLWGSSMVSSRTLPDDALRLCGTWSKQFLPYLCPRSTQNHE